MDLYKYKLTIKFIFKMMKWTRLQLNALPVIAIEADNAI